MPKSKLCCLVFLLVVVAACGPPPQSSNGGGGGGGGAGGGGGEQAPDLDAIVMGQSNAAAPAGAAHGPVEHIAPLVAVEEVTAWDGAGWTMADPDTNAGEGAGVGQWFGAFAFDAIAAGDVSAVRCVAQTQGGTSILKFLPGFNPHYAALLAKVAASGAEPGVFLWWQGEADYPRPPEEYRAHLETLWTSLKIDVPSLRKMVAFQIPNPACSQDSSNVRAAYVDFAADHDDVELVDLDDISGDPVFHDGCHYKRAGYLEAGARARAAAYP